MVEPVMVIKHILSLVICVLISWGWIWQSSVEIVLPRWKHCWSQFSAQDTWSRLLLLLRVYSMESQTSWQTHSEVVAMLEKLMTMRMLHTMSFRPLMWVEKVRNYLHSTFIIQGYEERFYPSKMWVCTRGSGSNGGFMKLFRYISGANSRSKFRS